MKYLKKFSEHSDYLNLLPNDLPNISYCEQEDELHYNLYTSSNKTNFINLYFTTVALESGTISFNIWKSMGTDMITSISYSTDNGETWTITQNQNNKSVHLSINVNVNKDDKILWKGDAMQLGFWDEDDYGDSVGSFFSSTCEFDAKGNIMSLLYGDDFKGKTTIENNYAFAYLFHDYEVDTVCKIVNAKNLSLPATTLADGCYCEMFDSCTSLTTVPDLPATTLKIECYRYMFYGCTSLTTAPKLPAITLAEVCYSSMFEGCTSLTVAPELPATTLANWCYSNMFSGCTSLTTVPELPATTLADHCYNNMFQNCTSLTTAPELPATTLVSNCYVNMFRGCTSLIVVPELPAKILAAYCYHYMFYGCTNLNYIKAMFTTTPSATYTNSWVYGVASSGIFVKNSAATWNITGTSGIPEGWNVYTEDDLKAVKHYELDESELAISAALNDLNSRTSLTEITYAELKELRDNSNLVPGKKYRITDYVATVDSYMEPYARSANHQFDIIVTADSVNKLNEQARAIQHIGDAYFANSNLEAWELKYQLDNTKWSKQIRTYLFNEDNNYTFFAIGTIKLGGHTYQLLQGFGTFAEDLSDYALVDTLEEGKTIYCYYGNPENFNPQSAEEVGTVSSIDTVTEEGKGTILWMKDEWDNECPYDFKNIQFKRWKATDAISRRLGLNELYMIADPDNASKKLSVDDTEDYIWAYTFSSDNSGGDQTDFSLGGHNVHDNMFKPYGDLLPNNVMFGESNYGNSFGLNCYYNSWGNNCWNNSWGNNCYNNSWGNYCQNNSWGNSCYNNSWGIFCQNNSWGNGCYNNSLSNDCFSNSWGNNCYNNSWGSSCKDNSCGNFYRHNSWSNDIINSTVFDGVQYTQITTNKVQLVQVLNGVQGTASSELTLAFAANKTYTQVACKTSAGALKIYVPGDLS